MLLLAALVLAQAAEGVALETPKGWIRTEDPQKRIAQLRPPDVPQNRECELRISPPVDVAATTDALLDQLIGTLTAGKQVQGDIQRYETGIFKVALLSQKTPQGSTEYLAIHATVWGKRGQSIVYRASDFEIFKRYSPDVLAVLSKATAPKSP
jgi:hypothetical protein